MIKRLPNKKYVKVDILRYVGFTLAETLITLTIIGVVAAMTIPTIISKYQEQVIVTKAKKGYSILSTALKIAENDSGPLAEEYLDSTGIYTLYKWVNDRETTSEILSHYIKGRVIDSNSYGEKTKVIQSDDGIYYEALTDSDIAVYFPSKDEKNTRILFLLISRIKA